MPNAGPVSHAPCIATNTVTRFARHHAGGFALAVLFITAAGTGAAVFLLATTAGAHPDARQSLIDAMLTILPYGLVASVLINRRPDLPFGWLLGLAALGLTIGVVTVIPAVIAAHAGDLSTLWSLRLSGLFFLPVGIQGLINVRFPSGQAASRWGRALELTLWIGLGAAVFSTVFGGAHLRDMVPSSTVDAEVPPLGGAVVGRVAEGAQTLAPVVVLLGLVAGIGVVVRYWRARGNERQQLKWRAAGVIVGFALFPFAITDQLSHVLDSIDSLVFVATLAIPVLRYRLWAIDTIIRRSVVYGTVTAVLVAGYALIAAFGASLASERVGASAAAIGAVLAFSPVRQLTQRVVDRLFYGRRSDPYRALSGVGQQLETAAGPVLPTVVTAIASSLRLPYVAIERDGTVLAAAGDPALAASAGEGRWALTFHAEPVGLLVASPRRGENAFDERDRRILADIARQAGPAVRAEALTADLLDARLRLVTAREDDRRRLRRDLHDGLGPMLTGLGLNLDAARARLAAADLERTAELLTHAKEASAQVIKDLRGMVYDLRPPALDDLGLTGAVQLHTDRLAAGTELAVQVHAEPLPDLPAAVEVAAFRTAIEAVTNAIRHGTTVRQCVVRLSTLDGELVLETTDDGRSTSPWRPGVGLTAMRERAEEIGGTLIAGPAATGGRVLARYPLTETA